MQMNTILGLIVIATGLGFYGYNVFYKKKCSWSDFTSGSVVCMFLVFMGVSKICFSI